MTLEPEILRRLLRAKDRMDAASHEEWPVERLARVSHISVLDTPRIGRRLELTLHHVSSP